jgi:thiamine biosynthesis lipoprotein
MNMTKFEFEAIGTHWVIDIYKELSSEEESSLLSKIQKRIGEFDRAYSRFRADSLVTQMSEIPGEYILPDDADKMISLYKKMYDATGGLVTPLIGKVLVDAGYDAEYSLEEKTPTIPESWEKIMVWGNPKLTVLSPALLDFGAGGKGYLVDIVSEILESEGVTAYCVDAGGDMRQRGDTLRVGLENPNNKEEAIGVANIQNQSLCGSAGNRRAWGKYHHIINPETLSSPKEILAVWVIADSTLLADLCTTGLYFVSPEALLRNFEFEYCILYSDYSTKKSSGFDAEVFR